MRTFIHIAGRTGVGKTTLAEQILEARKTRRIQAVRGVREEELDELVEVSGAKGDPELARYRSAGAAHVARCRFNAEVSVDYYESPMYDLISLYDGILAEGDWPFFLPPAFTVFVAPPLPAGESLLRRVTVDHEGAHEAQIASLEAAREDEDVLKAQVERAKRLLSAELGFMAGVDEDEMLMSDEEMIQQLVQVMDTRLEELRRKGPKPPTQRWTLAPGYEDITEAQAVVINVDTQAQRARAEEMLEEVRRMRKDQEVFDDLFDWRGTRTRITRRVADLRDPKEKGTKDIVRRVYREIDRS